jgi:hypothetical protein
MATISKDALKKAIRAAIHRLSQKPASQGKAYELKTALKILSDLRAQGGFRIACNPRNANHLTFAGSPCQRSAGRFDFIEVWKGAECFELWISLQFTTLSHDLGGRSRASTLSDHHEIDVGIYAALPPGVVPSFENVVLAVSCKSGKFSKAHVREALGLRRELGYLDQGGAPCPIQWLSVNVVPSSPPSPLFLISQASASGTYSRSLEKLGLYVRHLP